MEKTLTIIDFMRKFSCEESCKSYLADQKWGDGFVCRRCGHGHAVKGRTRHHRRCGSCRFDELATSNTLFHKIKFPLPSAFAMVHLLTTTKKGMSSCELARQFGVHQDEVVFNFRKTPKSKVAKTSPVEIHLAEFNMEPL
jgi:DNA-directed RNA polymerase subunit RPC12/RpoP